MIFDRNRVIDSLCYDLEQWIGWKGYASDNLKSLKEYVEEGAEGAMTEIMRITNGGHCPFVAKGANWQFFYPVNPPKHKDELVPFDTCQELIEWFCKKEQCNIKETQRPFIWVKQKKGLKLTLLLTGFAEDNGAVWAEDQCIGMQSLLDNYTLLDGTPIGKETRG